jgi:hypothetical protein
VRLDLSHGLERLREAQKQKKRRKIGLASNTYEILLLRPTTTYYDLLRIDLERFLRWSEENLKKNVRSRNYTRESYYNG